MTLRDLMSRFSDEDCCRDLLERLRWPIAPENDGNYILDSHSEISGL